MIALFIFLNVYFVSFLDKPEKTAPQLSPRAVEQRAKWNIPTDGMDYPVSGMYLNQVRQAGGKVHHVSRWFNGATVEMDAKTAAKIEELSFVTAVEMTRKAGDTSSSVPRKKRMLEQVTYEQTLSTDDQLATYNLLPLHNAGYEGQGILMAICDGGFYNANTLSCFRQKELELGHFDFTDDDKYGYDFYGDTGEHGTRCLSVISGIQDAYYSSASKAQYYLMRSEENETESPKEMDNLVAALEKADSLGVNVFSVSLGYAWFDNDEWDLPKSALDGKSTRVSLAATIAARKGMLVCVAAGNEGNDESWRTISAPADADSILTVGAVTTDSIIGNFSSWGPSADGRIKPEVCAVGVRTTLINSNEEIVRSNGTSYATPLLAGMAASLWSALPNENAMQIRERIIRSADRYTNPDTKQYGYGIPNAWKAYQMSIPTGIENTEHRIPNTDSRKILRNGQILIQRGDKIYTLTGQRIQ
jgi:subtilisin family serine protease